jgi:DNA-binding SARP family transcriptional activator/tetratricopeptide (TPR) repeat protein
MTAGGSLLEVDLLGTLEVRVGGGPVALGPPKQRGLLALLALNANRVVAREQLVDELWGDHPPESADGAVQVYVSRLRKLLPAGTLVTQSPGYLFALPAEAVDVQRFERLVNEAAHAEPALASTLLREALALWRGSPLAEFGDEPFARREADRLQDLKLRALEERIEADLALGRETGVVGELTVLVEAYPYRERPRRQLMLALYRAGRQSEALDAYRDARAALAELGLEPGIELRNLERAILTQDPALTTAPRGPARPLPGPLLAQPAFPFVGRSDELASLRALLEQTERGRGAVAVLAGEAGGGKTRIARELAHQADARGALVLYGTSDADVRVPYGPLRQWLEHLLRVFDEDVLRDCLGDAAILGRLVPDVAALLETTVPQPTRDLEGDRYLLQRAATGLLERLARRSPVVAIADDAHWADHETLHLLRTLARAVPEARVLLVTAYRNIPPFDGLAELWRIEGVDRMQLGRLEPEDIAALVRESSGAEATPELVATITELTGGTPLLVCELLRELVTTGDVATIDDVRGPERIADGVQQRLTRLGSEVTTIVELASVAGPTFDASLIGRDHSAELEAAGAAGLIDELPGPTIAYRFTHELVRRAVYDRLTPRRRAELHLRIAEAFERTHADDLERVVQQLAVHFTQAAPVIGPTRAIAYNIRAAEAAVNADAYAEAEERLSAALGLGIDDDGARARVQTELALVLRGLGRFDQSEPLLSEVRNEPFADSQRRFVRLMNDPTVVAEEFLEEAERAVETFASAGDTYRLSVAWRHYGLLRRRQGRLAESVVALESAVSAAVTSGRHDAYRWAVGSLAYVLCDGPAPVADALRRIDEIERSGPDDAMSAAILGQFKGVLLAMGGRLREARDHLEQSDAAFHRSPTGGANRPAYREPVAEAWELLGEPGRAEDELAAKYEHYWVATHVDAQALQAAYRLALLCCDEGRWDEAERWAEYGRDTPVGAEYHSWAVLGLAARARITARRGDVAAALETGRRAVALAERSDKTNLHARTCLALAEIHARRGETSSADAAVAAALRLYDAKGNVIAAERALSVASGREA